MGWRLDQHRSDELSRNCWIRDFDHTRTHAHAHTHTHTQTHSLFTRFPSPPKCSYVHRLIQSKTDGKLVELPEPRGGRFDDEVDVLKSESLVMEFDQLLRIQLDSQRAFFEDELRKLSEDRDERVTEIETRLVRRLVSPVSPTLCVLVVCVCVCVCV